MHSLPMTPLSTRIYAWFTAVVTNDIPLMYDLLAQGVPVDVPHPLRQTTALMEATRRGNAAMVQWLLTRGATPAFLCSHPQGTPLHCALRLRFHDIAKQLIDASADVNVADGHDRTPLHVLAAEAAEYPSAETMLELAAALIDKQCPLDALDREGLTALHYAVIADHPPLAELLLTRGANPNVTVPDTHMSPLAMVALDRNGALAALLIRHGANPDQPAHDGSTPATLFPGLGADAAKRKARLGKSTAGE